MLKKIVMTISIFSMGLLVAACANDRAKTAKSAPVDQTTAATAKAEVTPYDAAQKICPVMKGDIDKNVYLDYQGKRVYFCCPGCKDTFLKTPGKYLAAMGVDTAKTAVE
jgi:YHS domain-containing protein